MIILHIAETAKGGVSSVINALTENDCNSNCESYVLIPNTHSKYIVSSRTIKYTRTGRNVISFLRLAISAYRNINRLKPDVIHLHSSFSGFIIRLLFFFGFLNFHKTNVLYTPHAFSFMIDGSFFKKKIFALIERILSIKTDKIICTSEYEKKTALEFGLSSNKLIRIYNGVEINKRPFHHVNSTYNKTINILFVGRLDYQKGYDYLIEIINQLSEDKFFFHIIGDSVVDEAISKSDKKNVKYYGWVDGKGINKFYQMADLLIMPSRWESFGIVAIEAQNNSLPVLGNNKTSLPEVVRDKFTGVLLDFEKKESVVKYIENISMDEWSYYRGNCHAYVKENFNVEGMIESYYGLYSRREK